MKKYQAIGSEETIFSVNFFQICDGDSIEEIETKLINDGFKKGKDGIYRGWIFDERIYDEGDGYLEPDCESHFVKVSIELSKDL